MAQTIALPDGTQLNFPDGMSDGDMASAIQKNFPQYNPSIPAGIDTGSYNPAKDSQAASKGIIASSVEPDPVTPWSDGSSEIMAVAQPSQDTQPTKTLTSKIGDGMNAVRDWATGASDVPNDVGLAESTARGFGGSAANTAKTVGLITSSIPVMAEAVTNAYQRATGGKEDTSWQDAAFRSLVDPAQNAVDYYAIKPEERQSLVGKIASGVGGILADLPQIIASGGMAELPEVGKVLQTAPGAMEFIGQAFSAGATAMRPVAIKAATEKAQQVLEQGGTVAQATNSALTAGMLTLASGAAPMSLGGGVAKRAVTGFPTGVAVGEVNRQVQNMADPDNMQTPFSVEGAVISGAQGAILAGTMPGHESVHPAPDRIDLGYSPDVARTGTADAVRQSLGIDTAHPWGEAVQKPDALVRNEPAPTIDTLDSIRPLAPKATLEDIASAPTHDAAIAAFNAAVPDVKGPDLAPKAIEPAIPHVHQEKSADQQFVDGLNSGVLATMTREHLNTLTGNETPDQLKALDTKLSEAIAARKVTLYEPPADGVEPAGVAELRKLAEGFNQKLVLSQGKGPNGLYAPDGTIVINVDSGRALTAILGHELGHRLQQENPAMYQAMVDHMRPAISTSAIKATLEKYGWKDTKENRTQAIHELANDMVGNRLSSESFWQSGKAKNPTLFAALANHVKAIMADAKRALFDSGLKPTADLQSINDKIDSTFKTHFGLEEAATPLTAKPEPLGRNNTPISEGGKPFKTNAEAKKAQLLNPLMRVLASPDGKGYILAPKTAKQLAAQAKAGSRLANSTGNAGQPMSAHEFIAREGGMDRSAEGEIGVQGNPRIGAKYLYAGKDRPGLTLEQATEKLKEAGFLPADATHSDAAAMIRKSLTNPQYTPEGTERMAQAEQDTRFADHMNQQVDESQSPDYDPFVSASEHGYVPEDSDGLFEKADPQIQAEVAALIQHLESIGMDGESAFHDVAMQHPHATDQEFYELAKKTLETSLAEHEAIARGDSDSGKNDSQQGEAGREDSTKSQSELPDDLTHTTPEQLRADSERAAAKAKAERDKKAAEDKQAKLAQERKEIAAKSEAAADTFELGGNAEDNLSGQGSMFSLDKQNIKRIADILDANGVFGKERLDILKDVKEGNHTLEDVQAAYPNKPARGTNEVMTNKDVVGNQGGRSADDTTPGDSQRKADISAEIYRLKERYSSLAFNDPEKFALKDRLNSLRAEFAALGTRKQSRPSDQALQAKYDAPDQVPVDVRNWVKDNASLLTSDATDAVRWNRIADSLDDDRFPSGDLTIYRAVADGDELRAGDWVTTDRKYAEMHLSKYLNGKGEILEEVVNGRDVLVSPTGNNEESIYAPRSLSGPVPNESTAPDSGGAKYSLDDKPIWRSALRDGIDAMNVKAQGGDGWRAQIKGLISKGTVKADEVEWSGLDDFLKMQTGKVSKQQVLDFLQGNGVQVHEVHLESNPVEAVQKKYEAAMQKQGATPAESERMFNAMLAFSRDQPHNEEQKDSGFKMVMDAGLTGNEIHDATGGSNKPKYDQYTLPGGENYREVLLTLPPKDTIKTKVVDAPRGWGDTDGGNVGVERTGNTGADYRSSHWEQPNVLAHIRLNDRVDADGKKVLLVEEIQSDFGQDIKKKGASGTVEAALKANGMTKAEFDAMPKEDQEFAINETRNMGLPPSAPFVGKTDAWVSLALKRVIKMAVDGGYDKVAFVNGEQSADRYDLSKQVKQLSYQKNEDGTFKLSADTDGRGSQMVGESIPADKLEDHVGKEIAQRIVDGAGEAQTWRDGYGKKTDWQVLKDLDLKVGGEGMKAFYDKILPSVAKDVLRKLGGGQMEKVSIYKQGIEGKQLPEDAKPAALRDGRLFDQPGFSITPAMQEKAAAGMPMFSLELPGAKMLDHATTRLSDMIDHGLTESGIYDKIAPMSAGTQKTRALAQNWINSTRVAEFQWNRIDDYITKHFDEAQRKRMWNAADEENDIRRMGQNGKGKGLDSLPADERAVVDRLHQYSQELWDRAKEVGMVQGDGVDFWTPRMMVTIGENGDYEAPSNGKQASSDGKGRNLTTSASSTKKRKYELSSETEAAMRAGGNELVRDIRTMPLAMSKLEKAIAGRELVNQIKDLGRATGKETTSNSSGPGFFTMDHPAFFTNTPRMKEVAVSPDELAARDRYIEDGQVMRRVADSTAMGLDRGVPLTSYKVGKDGAVTQRVPATDSEGNVIMDRTPIYISNDFKGPLNAILSQNLTNAKAYTGYMLLKSKSMSTIMYSPLTHGQTILGRSINGMGLIKTATLAFTGHSYKSDADFMKKMIGAGMVPIGNHNSMLDVGDIARGHAKEGTWTDPNESWIGLGAKKIGNGIKDGFGDTLKKGVDVAGDFWHNKMLWDRIGDLQAGIAHSVYLDAKKYGLSEISALRAGVHFANRYAGAMGKESMSEIMHMTANVMLFSKSFNAGNIGTVKDMFYGLPAGLKAQVLEYAGDGEKALSFAKKKAFIGFVREYAYSIAALTLAAMWFKRDKDADWSSDSLSKGVSKLDRIGGAAWEQLKAHPMSPTSYNPYRLSATWNNEPGKDGKIDMGAQPNGRHEYIKPSLGKVPEDLAGWMFHLPTTAASKASPAVKTLAGLWTNSKDPYGTPIVDPADESMMSQAADVAKYIVGQNFPLDQLRTAKDIATGDGTELDKSKLIGSAMGFSVSQGHPQGPEAAVAAKVEERIKASKAYVLEAVKYDLKYGNEEKAMDRLEKIGLTPRETMLMINHLQNPKQAMSKQARRNFIQHANEEEQGLMDSIGQ